MGKQSSRQASTKRPKDRDQLTHPMTLAKVHTASGEQKPFTVELRDRSGQRSLASGAEVSVSLLATSTRLLIRY